MLRYAMYVTVNIIFIHFDMHSFDMSYILTLVWPPKGLRNRLVASGRESLCTTAYRTMTFHEMPATLCKPIQSPILSIDRRKRH